jgi:hypothetical protein
VEQIYFPHNAVISLVAMMQDGRTAETGTLGREGFTGSETMLGNNSTATSRSFKSPVEHRACRSQRCAHLLTSDRTLAIC